MDDQLALERELLGRITEIRNEIAELNNERGELEVRLSTNPAVIRRHFEYYLQHSAQLRSLVASLAHVAPYDEEREHRKAPTLHLRGFSFSFTCDPDTTHYCYWGSSWCEYVAELNDGTTIPTHDDWCQNDDADDLRWDDVFAEYGDDPRVIIAMLLRDDY